VAAFNLGRRTMAAVGLRGGGLRVSLRLSRCCLSCHRWSYGVSVDGANGWDTNYRGDPCWRHCGSLAVDLKQLTERKDNTINDEQ
jgi:hypothetical protein